MIGEGGDRVGHGEPSLAGSRDGDLVRRTVSPCPQCLRPLEAEILRHGADLNMRKRCPDHGPFELFFWRNADFFEKVMEIVGDGSDGQDLYTSPESLPHLRGLQLDLTTRCNLACANCFANANVASDRMPSLEEIQARVRSVPGRRPVVYLTGGEPTLRTDLVEILRFLKADGCVVKLVTNGLKLVDESYAAGLREAGLEWVFLQFDGFQDSTYVKFRGRPMLAEKMKALEVLSRGGFKILLACMVENGTNLHEVGEILRLATETHGVQEISFLPASCLGRNRTTMEGNRTTAVDVMDALCSATSGTVGREDFLSFFKISKALYRLTGNPDYKPKSCFFPMALVAQRGRFLPVNRFLDPLQLFKEASAIPALAHMLRHVRRIDNMPFDRRILTLVIENFRSADTIDLRDARNCNKFYVLEGGYSPSCIYNTVLRPRGVV